MPESSQDDRYEGVLPRHSICGRCGYYMGGVEVRGGVLVCPECGDANPVSPVDHARQLGEKKGRAAQRLRVWRRVVVCGFVLAAALVIAWALF